MKPARKSKPPKAANKIPHITFGFWVIKILSTTFGETAGDVLSMSLALGYLASTAVFSVVFFIAVFCQIKARHFHPFLYWLTIIATTTLGTTLADFINRSLGLGYAVGSLVLLGLLLLSLLTWRVAMGSVSVARVTLQRAEMFYWVTVMFSQTLGTGLGDWMADNARFGYLGSALVFGALLVAVLLLYFCTRVSRTALFWIAFVVTRPLGAVIGDFLDKPHDHGGLDLSRYTASLVLLTAIVVCILLFGRRPLLKSSDHCTQ